MTKTEYLTQLDYKLRVMPHDERKDALEYYEGYLSDADNERDAISQLGSPGEVAANILANYVAKTPQLTESRAETRRTRTSGIRTAWVITLAIFALPVGLPIILSLAVIPFALIISLGSIIIGVGATGIGLMFGGLIGIVTFPFVVTQEFGFGLMTGGMGLLYIGLGILFIKWTSLLVRGFPMIARFVGRLILKGRNLSKRRKDEETFPAESPALRRNSNG